MTTKLRWKPSSKSSADIEDLNVPLNQSFTDQITLTNSVDLPANLPLKVDNPVSQSPNVTIQNWNFNTQEITVLGTTLGTYQISWELVNQSGARTPDQIQNVIVFNPNQPPQPNPDSFTTPTNVPKIINSSQILSNDTDPDGDNLTVSSVFLGSTYVEARTDNLELYNLSVNPSTNLVLNPGFESGNVNYALEPGWTIAQDAGAYQGNWSGRFYGTGSRTALRSTRVSVTPGQNLLARAKCMVSKGFTQICVRINYFDSNGVEIETGPQYQGNYVSGITWEDSTVSLTVPSSILVFGNPVVPAFAACEIVCEGTYNDTTPKGTLTTTGNPITSFTYTPTSGFRGIQSLGYIVSDGNGGTAQSYIDIEVLNGEPTAISKSSTTDYQTPVVLPESFFLSGNTDPNSSPYSPYVASDTFKVSSVTQPVSGGTVSLNSGNVTFTPSNGFSGSTQFTYRLVDKMGGISLPGTVSISVGGAPNVAPVANNDSFTTAFNTPITITNAQIVANDTDSNGDSLTVYNLVSTNIPGSITGNQSSGAFTLNPNSSLSLSGLVNLTFTPTSGFTGSFSIQYRCTDGNGGNSNLATITFTVSANPNLPPTVNQDAFSTNTNTAKTILASEVLSNDTDPNGDTLVVTNVTLGPSYVTAYVDNMTLSINGGANQVNNSGFESGDTGYSKETHWSIVNVGGSAFSGSWVASYFGTGSRTALRSNKINVVPGQSVSVSAQCKVISGFTKVCARITYYNAAGVEFEAGSFQNGNYVLGNAWELSTYTQTVPATITIGGNTFVPATATCDVVCESTFGDSAPKCTLTTTGNPITSFTITPMNGFRGGQSFNYTISDGNGGTATGFAYLEVLNANPIATAKSFNTTFGNAIVIPVANILTGCTDANSSLYSLYSTSDTLTLNTVGTGTGGTVVWNSGAGTVTVTPNSGFSGNIVFPYTVRDLGGGISNSANITVTVAANQAPVAGQDFFTTGINVPLVVNSSQLLSNDSDPEGKPLTITNVSIGVPVVRAAADYFRCWNLTDDPGQTTNLTIQPGMENGDDQYWLFDGGLAAGWQIVNGPQPSYTGGAYEGSWYGFLSKTGQRGAIRNTSGITGMANKTVKASAFVRVVTGPTQVYVRITPFNSSWVEIPTYWQGNIVTGNSWMESTVTVTLPSWANNIQVEVVCEGIAATPQGTISTTGNPITSFTFTPNSGYSGEHSISYTVSDGNLSTTGDIFVVVS